MAQAKVSFTISAVDRASEMLDKINRRLSAANAPVERLNKQWTNFAKQSGLEGLTQRARGLASAGLDAFRSIARIIAPLGAITGAASIAGMERLVEQWGEFGSKLGFSAARLGTTAGQLQTLQGAARLAGSSAASMTSGLTTLGQTMTDAIGGRAPEAVVMFNTLGIAFQDAAGRARPVAEVLPEIADKVAGIRDPFLQARVATSLLGGAAEDLLPFLRLGSKGIAQYSAMAQRYGVMNDAGAEAANRMRQAQVQLGLAVEGLGNSVAEKLAPVITPLLTDMAEWIAANRTWIATDIGVAVKDLADWLRKVNWAGVAKEAAQFGAIALGIGRGIVWVGQTALWIGGILDRVFSNNYFDPIFAGLSLVNPMFGLMVGQTDRVKSALEGVALFVGGLWLTGMLKPFLMLSRMIWALGRSVITLAASFGRVGPAAAQAVESAATAYTQLGVETAASAAAPAAAAPASGAAASAGLGAVMLPAALAAGSVYAISHRLSMSQAQKDDVDKANAQQFASSDLDEDAKWDAEHPMTHLGPATDEDRARWDALKKQRDDAARATGVPPLDTTRVEKAADATGVKIPDTKVDDTKTEQTGVAAPVVPKPADLAATTGVSPTAVPVKTPDTVAADTRAQTGVDAADLPSFEDFARQMGLNLPDLQPAGADAPAQAGAAGDAGKVPAAPPRPASVPERDEPARPPILDLASLTVRRAAQVTISAESMRWPQSFARPGFGEGIAATASQLAPRSEIDAPLAPDQPSAQNFDQAPPAIPRTVPIQTVAAPSPRITPAVYRPPPSAGPASQVGSTQVPALAPPSEIQAPPGANPTQQLMSFFQSRGLSKIEAAGLVANATVESSLNPRAVGDGGHAIGIGQWHEDRAASFKAAFGEDLRSASLMKQAEFMLYELQHGEKSAGNRLAKAQSAGEAGAIISRYYERPRDADGNAATRGRLAERIAAQTPDLPPIQVTPVAAASAPAVRPASAAPIDPAPVSGAGAGGEVNGNIGVTITHANPPPGATVTASASGNAFSAPPSVETSLTSLA
jgi:hypothetical protein